jgi:hypothetical protein
MLVERAALIYFGAMMCPVVSSFTIALDHLAGDRLTWPPVSVTMLGQAQ